jgi:nucleoside-diphosphate-sugar epimerase
MALGERLSAAGHEVHGLRRQLDGGAREELGRAGIQPVCADITSMESLERVPADFDWVVNTVSSARGGSEVYREVYYNGMRNLIDWLRPWKLKKFVYTSSTSVYAQKDGGWVDESSAAEPPTETGRWLVKAERLLQEESQRGFPAVILRVGGIYGPDRGHLFQQYLKGEAQLSGDGSRWINMVHRDDVAAAIESALQSGQPGEIYNVVDNESVTQRTFFEWLSVELHRPMPPCGDPKGSVNSKRAITHKRVSNQRLREALGWVPKYPTFREGYTPLIEAWRANVAGFAESR